MKLDDAAVVGFGDGDEEAFDFDGFSDLREVAEFLSDVAADGGDFLVLEFNGDEFFEFVEVEGASGGEFLAVFDEVELGFFGFIEFVFDIADDFFHDVVEGDDPDSAAVFVDGKSDVSAGFAEARKEFVDGEHFGDHEEVPFDLAEIGVGFIEEREKIFDMDEAEGFVEVAFDEREAGVFGVDGDFEVGLEAVFDVEGNDEVAWRHDIADAAVVEGEDVEEDVLFGGGHFGGFFTFGDDVAKFLFGVGKFGLGDGFDFEAGFEQPVGGAVEDPDGGFEEGVEKVEGGADGEGGAEGFANGEGLGHQFAEDDVEEGDDAVGEDVGEGGDDGFIGEADFEEDWLDEAVDEGFAKAAQGDTGEGDAELGGGEVAVEVLDLIAGADGAGFAFCDSGLELGTADFDDGEFSGDEEGVEEDEKENGEGAPSEFGAGNVPVPDQLFMAGEGQEGER